MNAVASPYPHGDHHRYSHGCRCDLCKAEMAANRRNREHPHALIRHCECGNILGVKTIGDTCYVCILADQRARKVLVLCAGCWEEKPVKGNVMGESCKRQIAKLKADRMMGRRCGPSRTSRS